MNGWGFLFWLASIAALFSTPIVLFVILMRLVGRIGSSLLVGVLAVDAVLWMMAALFWLSLPGG